LSIGKVSYPANTLLNRWIFGDLAQASHSSLPGNLIPPPKRSVRVDFSWIIDTWYFYASIKIPRIYN
jgi:hypothetical protein